MYRPNDDVQAFGIFVTWLYTDEIPPATNENIHSMLALLISSEMFTVEKLQNQTLDAVKRYYSQGFRVQAEQVLRVCENVRNSRLQDAMLHYAAHQLIELEDAIPPDYYEILFKGGPLAARLVDHLISFAKSHGQLYCICRMTKNCAYHSHQNTPKCTVI